MDVEVSPNGAPLFGTAGCASFTGGTKTNAFQLVQPLVATPTPCRFVWIGARIADNGTAQNASPCFIGDSANQNIPIQPTKADGVVISIDDASKVFLRVVTSGDGVVYRIFA